MTSSHAAPGPRPARLATGRRFATGPLLRIGAVTALASVAATVIIREIAVSVVTVPSAFQPLKVPSVVSLTILGVAGATASCFALNRLVRDSGGAFRRVAGFALLLSFIPDAAIWASHAYQHTARASTVAPLVIMHVAVGALCIVLLPRAAAPS